LMNGGDQRPPESWVTGAVSEANTVQDRYRFDVVDLARWLDDQRIAVPDADLGVWRGELRSAARAPLLSGVISNRVDVRAAAAAAERAVERRAEPLLALFRPAEEWAAAAPLLGVAWDRLIANSAHDSACACCSDAVADQVLVRYGEARQIGDALAGQALADLAAEALGGEGDVLVVNTLPATRSAIVEITAPAGRDPGEPLVGPDGLPRVVQLLGVARDEVFGARVAGEKVGWVADRIAGSTFDGRPVRVWSLDPRPSGGEAEAVAAGWCLSFEGAGPDDTPVNLDDARDALLALGSSGAEVTVRMDGPLRRRILFESGPVPGFGWTALHRSPGGADGGTGEPSGIPVRITAEPGGETVLDNGIVRVEVDPSNGTFSVTTSRGLRAAGLNRYVDGGDGGDTYTWCPPEVDTLVDRPESVEIGLGEVGPLRAGVTITTAFRWPVGADGDEQRCSARAADTEAVSITTRVSLTAGDPLVAVDTELDNRCRDHRLRVHFPLPEPVAASDAGCAFAVVHRGLEVDGGPTESPPPTFPARQFVDCASDVGLAVIADGTFEYEVCDGGRELAVTLLRATGWLSRRRLPLRPDPAGPAVPVEGAQVQGRRRWRYGLLIHPGNWEAAHLPSRAEAFLHPLEAAAENIGAGPAQAAAPTRPPHGRALLVGGASVSSVVRDPAGDVVVRLYHPGAGLAAAVVGERAVDLRPGEVATVRAGRRPPPG
jgi:mannosylglycerate hydrolase